MIKISRRHRAWLFAVPFTIASCSKSPAPQASSDSADPSLTTTSRTLSRGEREPLGDVPNELIVTFRSSSSRSGRDRALAKIAKKASHFADKNKKPKHHGGGKGPAFFDDLAVVTLADGVELEAAKAELKGHPDVERVEPNAIVSIAQALPNDPDFTKLWGLHNTGQTGGVADADVDAPEAWAYGRGSPDVVVAVIDSGVDYRHPDLSPNMWVNTGEIPGNKIDDDANGYVDDVHGADFVNGDGDPMDDHYHGTHCAGTVAAAADDGFGVAGVAPGARIMALKFLSSSGSGSTAGALGAIQYAMNNGAHVMSNSWGGGSPTQALQDAITAAYTANITFIAAAGNSNTTTPMYPAAYEHVVSVVALDAFDKRASFSNYGSTVDVSAPGVNIWSTSPGGGHRMLSGTSMACPHVSGAAALLKSRNAALTPDEMEAILESTADDLGTSGFDTIYGFGRVNAARAVASIEAAPTPSLALSLTSPRTGERIGGAVAVFGSASGDQLGSWRLEAAASVSNSWTLLAEGTGAVSDSQLGTVDVSAWPEGPIAIRLVGTDVDGKMRVAMIAPDVQHIEGGLTLADVAAPVAGIYEVTGSALTNAMPFGGFTVEWGEGASPTLWRTDRLSLTGGGTAPVANGTLARLDSDGVSGVVTFKLVVHGTGRSEEYRRTVNFDPWFRGTAPLVLTKANEPPTFANFDSDPEREILVTGESQGFVTYKLTGETESSVYQYLSGTQKINFSVDTLSAVGDFGAGPGLEIGFLNVGGSAFAFNGASIFPGYPKVTTGTLPSNYITQTHGPMIGDVDGDGSIDTVYVSANRTTGTLVVNAYDRSGNALPGFPYAHPYNSSVLAFDHAGAIGDLDGDGKAEIFAPIEISSTAQSLLGITHDGKLLAGFPKTYKDIGDIAIADVNGDGTKEIVFNETEGSTYSSGSKYNYHYGVHALDRSGIELAGFPFIDKTFTAASPFHGGLIAIGDVTGDGRPEIVSSPNWGQYGAVNAAPVALVRIFDGASGQVLGALRGPGGPGSDPSAIRLYDFDGDGKSEIVVAQGNSVRAFDASFNRLWEVHPRPAYNGSTVFRSWATPRGFALDVVDLEGDGDVEVVASYASEAASGGFIYYPTLTYIWDVPFADAPARREWPTLRGGIDRSGRYLAVSERGDAPPPPEAPASLALAVIDGTRRDVRASWPSVPTASGYTLEWTTSATFSGILGRLDVPATATGWTVTGLYYNATYYFRLRANNAGGGSSWVTGTIQTQPAPDNYPPSLSIYEPSEGQVFRLPIVTVRGYASDGNGIESVTVNGKTAALVGNSWTYDHTLTPGDNTITVVATEASIERNQTTSVVHVTYLQDATPPNLMIATPTADETLLVRTPSVVLGGLLSDNQDLASLSWTSSAGGGGSSAPTSPWSFTIPLVEGSNTITVTAKDRTGNVGTDTITIESRAPVCRLIAPVAGADFGTPVEFSAEASDVDGISKVYFHLNTAVVAVATTAPYAASWDSTTVRPGTYQVKAACQTPTGNEFISPSVTITIRDVTPPRVVLSSPQEGGSYRGAVSLVASATDIGTLSPMRYYVDGNLVGSSPPGQGFSFVTSTVPPGPHVITAECTDDAGNVGVSNARTINVLPADGTPPTVSITAPVAGAVVGGTVLVTAQASDAVSGVATLRYRVDGVVQATMSPPATWTWDSSKAVPGTRSLTVEAVDGAGNAAVSAAVAVTVRDVVAPSGVTNVSPAPGADNVNGSITFQWSAATDNGGAPRYQLQVDQDPAFGSPDVAPNLVSSTSMIISALPDAVFYWRVRAVDGASNAGPWSQPTAFSTRDTIAPQVAITAPSNGATVTGSVVVSATASDASGIAKVEFWVRGTLRNSDTSAPYAWSWMTRKDKGLGVPVKVRAVDTKGNVSESSITVNVQ